MMKTNIFKYYFVAILSFVSVMSASAQTVPATTNHDYVDTVAYKAPPVVDSTLVGVDIFHILHLKKSSAESPVTIHQSEQVEQSVRTHIIANRGRALNGYRIRIFFDNAQDARENSGAAYGTFLKYFRGIPAYRSYVNPYFKVTVGDFRTKAEAVEKLIRIKKVFPTAFVVKEKIRFPYVDRPDLEELPDSVEVFNF